MLNQGVTQTYLIVSANRRISFTGIANSTLIAKNWKVTYCRMLVRSRSFCSNGSRGNKRSGRSEMSFEIHRHQPVEEQCADDIETSHNQRAKNKLTGVALKKSEM